MEWFVFILRIILYIIFVFATYTIITNWDKKDVRKIVLSLGTILLFFCVTYLQFIPVWIFHLDVNNLSDIQNTLLNLFSNVSLVAILLFIYRKDLKKDLINFKKNIISNLEAGFKYWILGLVIMMVSNIILTIVTGGIAANEELVQGMIENTPFLALLSAGIIAPIVEELCFRKTIKDIIKNKYIGSILSGLLFGILHIAFSCTTFQDFLFIIPYGALGFTFSMMYYETNNAITPIFMHALHNSILTIISIVGMGFIIW